ncbi:MAG: stilbene synthase [Gammaproteobacteria bacterium]|nr:stilbene synthase [Gammaproteobacteria bacterium]
MVIGGLGTALPGRRYSQKECWEVLKASPNYANMSSPTRALMRRLLSGRNGIESRHLAVEPLAEIFDLTPDAMQRRFERHAPPLAARAAKDALAEAGIEPAALDAVIVSTCTGYLCPGISTYVVERLGLRQDVFALDLVGSGCGAALPNLHMAQCLLGSGDCERVLSICVEICSAAFYLDDDPGVLVSACLFGDGAAAAVLSLEPPGNGNRCVEWCACGSEIDPRHRDLLRFEHRGGMLRNVLTTPVPDLAAQSAERVLDRVLSETALSRQHIGTWIWHAAGRDVLAALRERLKLGEEDTRWSAGVLRECGNLSSASVLFALRDALAGDAAPGWWWMSAFGAGFSCHGALLRVR